MYVLVSQISKLYFVVSWLARRCTCRTCCPPASLQNLISQKVLISSLCKSLFPHKFVNLFFILVIKDKLTDLCGNCLLQNVFINTFCEINSRGARRRAAVRSKQADPAAPHTPAYPRPGRPRQTAPIPPPKPLILVGMQSQGC